jgi:hypothetical protein
VQPNRSAHRLSGPIRTGMGPPTLPETTPGPAFALVSLGVEPPAGIEPATPYPYHRCAGGSRRRSAPHVATQPRKSEMLSECGAWGGTRLRVAQFLANFWHGGVLFAHGARFGSHALYVKDNRLHYVYDFVGSLQQKVVATQDIPPGRTSSCRHRSTSRVRTPRASRPGSCRCITATTRSARHTSRPSPASCHRRGRAVRRPRQRLGRHRRLPGPAALALHRRHHQAARRRCQRRALHGPRARGRRHAAPGVDGTAGGRPRFPPNDVARARVMATLIQATRRVVAGPQGRP